MQGHVPFKKNGRALGDMLTPTFISHLHRVRLRAWPPWGRCQVIGIGTTTMIHNDSRRITNDPAMYSRCDQVEDTIAAKQSLLHPTNEHSPECHPRPTPLSNRVVHRARFCGFFVARPTACRRLEALEPFQGPS